MGDQHALTNRVYPTRNGPDIAPYRRGIADTLAELCESEQTAISLWTQLLCPCFPEIFTLVLASTSVISLFLWL